MICEPKPETSALHLREQKHCNKSCEGPLCLLTGLHPAQRCLQTLEGATLISMRSTPGLCGVRNGGRLKDVYIEH